MILRKQLLVMVVFGVFLHSGVYGLGEWLELGGSLNVDDNQDATWSSLHVCEATPYVAWQEGSASGTVLIYVKSWDNGNWSRLGGSLNRNATKQVGAPSLFVSNHTPYVAWQERDASEIWQIYVKFWNGSDWISLGECLNEDVTQPALWPSLHIYNDIPYVAWIENDASDVWQLYVKSWSGTDWNLLGASLNKNVSKSANAPSLYIDKGTPYTAWMEYTLPGNAEIFVKSWQGSNWVQLGGSLNLDANQHGYSPSLYVDNSTPYIAWAENKNLIGNINVKTWTGSDWARLGGSLNMEVTRGAFAPSLFVNNHTPYAAWVEESITTGHGQIRVKSWNGSDWDQLGNSLNMEVNRAAFGPSLFADNGTLNTAWFEYNTSGIQQIYVKYYTVFTPSVYQPQSGSVITAYPNPGRDNIQFTWDGDQVEHVRIDIYNIAGKRVARLSDQFQAGESQILNWDCNRMAPGIYIYCAVLIRQGQAQKPFVNKVAVIR
ncbi:T9SS type A sorting domain-containing protein [bacterium]|nr:T9SS type A sorting domain-containing protein [bacterium]